MKSLNKTYVFPYKGIVVLVAITCLTFIIFTFAHIISIISLFKLDAGYLNANYIKLIMLGMFGVYFLSKKNMFYFKSYVFITIAVFILNIYFGNYLYKEFLIYASNIYISVNKDQFSDCKRNSPKYNEKGNAKICWSFHNISESDFIIYDQTNIIVNNLESEDFLNFIKLDRKGAAGYTNYSLGSDFYLTRIIYPY